VPLLAQALEAALAHLPIRQVGEQGHQQGS
jgi:hypothetical protein